MRHWMAEAHLKRLWSRSRREGIQSELKTGWMTFPALHTQISGTFPQSANCCSVGPQRRKSVGAAVLLKSRVANLGIWARRFWVEQKNAATLGTLRVKQKKIRTSWEYWPISCWGASVTSFCVSRWGKQRSPVPPDFPLPLHHPHHHHHRQRLPLPWGGFHCPTAASLQPSSGRGFGYPAHTSCTSRRPSVTIFAL